MKNKIACLTPATNPANAATGEKGYVHSWLTGYQVLTFPSHAAASSWADSETLQGRPCKFNGPDEIL